MLLSDLPDDILGLISFWLNGFDNCSLWMASDSILRQRLVNNVITEFSIKYRIPGRYLWPGNFLKKLKRLSRLSLVVDKDVYHLPIENIELFPIETLKYLKIECLNSDQMFKQKQSNHSMGPTTSSNDSPFINNLNDLYPNLESFECGNQLSVRDIRSNISIDCIRFLPKNLKSLSLPNNPLKIDLKDVNINKYILLLPCTLTSLNLSFSIIRTSDFLDFSILPPNLTSLTTNIQISEESYAQIPQQLKHFNFLFEHDIQKLSKFLPSGLETLSLTSNSMPGDSLAHLDRLENLTMFCSSDESTFFTKCPPNLKFCHAYFDQYLHDVEQSSFAEGLVELLFYTELRLTRSFLESLPDSITSLKLKTGDDLSPTEFFESLPKHLKSLECNYKTEESLSLLPDSLTSLKLLFAESKYAIAHHYDDDDYEEDDDASFRLPPNLETLVLGGPILPRSIMKIFPETLKVLEFKSKSVTVYHEDIACLPRGLTHLKLETYLKISDATADKYPPNLTYLSQSESDDMSDNAIAKLPRSLTYLDLRSDQLTDECIKYLPRKLVHLYLIYSTRITWRCCQDLPPYLGHLGLPSCHDWNMEALPALPKYLKVFNVFNLDLKVAFDKMSQQKRNE